MKTYSKQRPQIQPVSDLPLFSWRAAVRRPATPAGHFICRRYRVHPAVADLIANLAGIGSGVEQ
ncbi:hypothetical protein GGD65_003210 [Bradyrhizobium sp. CIR18]|nr:hypothetical protein [Bradyrhizobium sp. CIR18]